MTLARVAAFGDPAIRDEQSAAARRAKNAGVPPQRVRELGNECGKCGALVWAGAQCSLCRRWYHTTAPPSEPATATDSPGVHSHQSQSYRTSPAARRYGGGGSPAPPSSWGRGAPRSPGATSLQLGGELKLPPCADPAGFRLMPFFCDVCIDVGAVEYAALLGYAVDDDFSASGVFMLNEAAVPHEEPDQDEEADDNDATANEHRRRELLRMVFAELAAAPTLPRSSETRRRWRELFRGSVLRKMRAHLVARSRPEYGDAVIDEAVTDERSRTTQVALRTMPMVVAVDTAAVLKTEAAQAAEARAQHNHHHHQLHAQQQPAGQPAAATTAAVLGHPAAMQKQADTVLRQQRRMWLGEALDYGAASARRATTTTKRSSSAALLGNDTGDAEDTGGALQLMSNAAATHRIRTSHITVIREDSDDGDTVSGGSSPHHHRMSDSNHPF